VRCSRAARSRDGRTLARGEALWALGPNPASQADQVIACLDHPDEYVASWAAASLARSGTLHLGSLLDSIAEPRLSDRALHWSLRALRDMAASSPAVVPALHERLGDSRPHVRARAAQALGRIGPAARAAEDRLQICADDQDPRSAWPLAAPCAA